MRMTPSHIIMTGEPTNCLHRAIRATGSKQLNQLVAGQIAMWLLQHASHNPDLALLEKPTNNLNYAITIQYRTPASQYFTKHKQEILVIHKQKTPAKQWLHITYDAIHRHYEYSSQPTGGAMFHLHLANNLPRYTGTWTGWAHDRNTDATTKNKEQAQSTVLQHECQDANTQNQCDMTSHNIPQKPFIITKNTTHKQHH